MCIWNAVFGVLMLELGIYVTVCAGVLPPPLPTAEENNVHNTVILENNSAAVLNDFSFPSAYEIVW